MTKFAFTVPPFSGHINPTLSLGSTLIERGHEVAWITLDDSLRQHLPKKGELLCVEHSREDLENHEGQNFIDLLAKKAVYGIESFKYLYEDVLIPINQYMVEKVSEILDQYEPDLVINDNELFAGAIAAYRKGIPYATTVTTPASLNKVEELPKVYEWVDNKIIELQKAGGIDLDEKITRSTQLNLVFTSREFFGEETELPDYYHFVGPVIQGRTNQIAFDWENFNRADYPHKILVSIGTTFDHTKKKDFFAKVIEAFKNEPIHVVIISDPELFDQWPENFLVQNQVPQLEILPHLDAVICHGGHNTISETLFQGIPLVVLPIAYDQQYIASRVSETGVGVKLNFKRFKPEILRSTLKEVLSEKKFKKNAVGLKKSFEKTGGTVRAASLLEELAVTPHIVST